MSIITDRKDMYKVAPTFLHNLEGEAKLFSTQEAVDRAWTEGWFGPPWAVKSKPRISEIEGEFATKGELGEEVDEDPRYEGLTLNLSRSRAEILERIVEFEDAEGIVEAPDGDE